MLLNVRLGKKLVSKVLLLGSLAYLKNAQTRKDIESSPLDIWNGTSGKKVSREKEERQTMGKCITGSLIKILIYSYSWILFSLIMFLVYIWRTYSCYTRSSLYSEGHFAIKFKPLFLFETPTVTKRIGWRKWWWFISRTTTEAWPIIHQWYAYVS